MENERDVVQRTEEPYSSERLTAARSRTRLKQSHRPLIFAGALRAASSTRTRERARPTRIVRCACVYNKAPRRCVVCAHATTTTPVDDDRPHALWRRRRTRPIYTRAGGTHTHIGLCCMLLYTFATSPRCKAQQSFNDRLMCVRELDDGDDRLVCDSTLRRVVRVSSSIQHCGLGRIK